MRKPNPDPHPVGGEDEISPEKILWRQVERYLIAQANEDTRAMEGILTGLSDIVSQWKPEEWEKRMLSVMEENTISERQNSLFLEIIRLISARGKWLSGEKQDAEPGTEFAFGFS